MASQNGNPKIISGALRSTMEKREESTSHANELFSHVLNTKFGHTCFFFVWTTFIHIWLRYVDECGKRKKKPLYSYVIHNFCLIHIPDVYMHNFQLVVYHTKRKLSDLMRGFLNQLYYNKIYTSGDCLHDSSRQEWKYLCDKTNKPNNDFFFFPRVENIDSLFCKLWIVAM